VGRTSVSTWPVVQRRRRKEVLREDDEDGDGDDEDGDDGDDGGGDDGGGEHNKRRIRTISKQEGVQLSNLVRHQLALLTSKAIPRI
jgi:hypothetical protein